MFRQDCPPGAGGEEDLSRDRILVLTRKCQFGWLKLTFLSGLKLQLDWVLNLGLLMWSINFKSLHFGPVVFFLTGVPRRIIALPQMRQNPRRT